ncbi:MAG: GNAT family N-acetyltransferase [Coriobacteriia bacterium]
MRIERATLDDAEEILALIKRAFGPVAEQYGDPTLPPLVETLDEHRSRYRDHVVLKATDGGHIIGSVQGALRGGGTCEVARLVVDPARQNEGVGRALAVAIESAFPEARSFELFTGHLSQRSLALYRSLGYTEVRRQRESNALTLVWLRKSR